MDAGRAVADPASGGLTTVRQTGAVELPPALYLPADDGWAATALTIGPWDAGLQHAGPPAALLLREAERASAIPGGQTVRLSFDVLGPVPADEGSAGRPPGAAQVVVGRRLLGDEPDGGDDRQDVAGEDGVGRQDQDGAALGRARRRAGRRVRRWHRSWHTRSLLRWAQVVPVTVAPVDEKGAHEPTLWTTGRSGGQRTKVGCEDPPGGQEML